MSEDPIRRVEPAQPGVVAPHIVHLDPEAHRAVSPYSPEGEIMMMGDLAAGLAKRRLSRPMAIGLLVVFLLPLIVSVVGIVSTW